MSFIVREDFLEPNEQSPKLVPANSYDKMMWRENYLNFTSATNSEVEVVDWNNHGWEEEGKEPLDSLYTKFDHWKVKGLGVRPIIEGDFFAFTPTPHKSHVSIDNFSGNEPNFGTNNLNRSKYNATNPTNIITGKHNFSNVSGKGKMCKSAGLTGVEKKACKANIKTTCGKKPLFGKAKKQAWAECSKGVVVTPEQQAQTTAEKIVPTSGDTDGLSTGAKVMLIVAGLGTIALVGFAIIRNRKLGAVQTQALPLQK